MKHNSGSDDKLALSIDLRGAPQRSVEVGKQAERRTPAEPRVPVLSFFSGAGFLDLGFEKAGFDVIWRNEFNKEFSRASQYAHEHRKNGREILVDERSIVDVGPKDALNRAFGSSGVPETFGMIGGPPCPDFSIGGKNRGAEGDRGKLTEVYCNRILEIEPSFFLLENVRGLLSTKRHREFLNRQISRLQVKYRVSLNILNALDFGVPQDRERVFLIGYSNKWIKRHYGRSKNSLAAVSWPTNSCYAGAKRRFQWPRTNPFGTRIDKPREIPEELTVWGAIGDTSRIRSLPNGLDCFRPRTKKFAEIDEGDDRRKSFKRLHRWRYSPTVAYGNNEVHLHPTEARRITVREALRLQSVPDDYAFPPNASLSDKFKMVGNGVPVRLATAVALAIADTIHGGGK